MITSLYETHIQAANLERSIAFYQKLGLELAHVIEHRRRAFFYIGKGRQMLGVQEVEENQEIQLRHYAFEVALEKIGKGIEWLRQSGIQPTPAFGREPVEPLVHTWMPAASIYFDDPDGNSLELIALLNDKPDASSHEVIYFSEWISKMHSSAGKENLN
ncbi:VOC family protein [Paenibacillus sp. JX-17]|uniref:VOC family protein n=1 Tax=Paenibacillus lacisoli TaxID=3064525 RepID=A0ABT9CEF3_9BACL|nr:VOC family protein [Paenibacillus sp. JX-17]MDO7906938.1 VOC family protein [Paenibacillus sp. JX-17]